MPDKPLPKKVGRPKGTPKTGGRKKGTKNWTNPQIRDALLEKSDAINVLADVVAGKQMYAGSAGSVGKPGWRYSTLQQRLQALQILLNKVVPDLKAQEITGADGKPLALGNEPTNKGLALAVMAVLQDAGEPINILDSALPEAPTLTAEALEAPTVERSAVGVSPPDKPKIGEHHQYENGSKIVLIQIEGSGERKWAVYDQNDLHHSYRRKKEDAERVAKALP